MNNSSPFGLADFDLADRGRYALERRNPQREEAPLPPRLWQRKISSKLSRIRNRTECFNCKRINFHKIFDGDIQHDTAIPHSTLYDIIRNKDCHFCRHVCRAVMDKFGWMTTGEQKATFCDLYYQYGWIGHGRVEKKDLHTQPRLEVRLEHNSSSRSSYDPSCASVATTVLLERYTFGSTQGPGEQADTLTRKLMNYKFDPRQLRIWLAMSKKSTFHSKKTSLSLDFLLREGRFRVVDVWTNEIVTLSAAAPYVAISYVWGKGQQGHLSAHYAAVEKRDSVTGITQPSGLDPKTLPLTIIHAMALVKSINERYLWVDALCVQQDDAEDKATVISEMSAIYGNAYVTIIAADGSHADERISRLSGKDRPEALISFKSYGRSLSLLPAPPGMEDALKATVWSSRGWTLQERLLSKRCVIFTKFGVFFECEAFSESEAYQIKASAFKLSTNGRHYGEGIYNKFLHTTQWNFETYSYAVQEYTARDFSHDGDRLDAFMGIMRQRSPQDLLLHHLRALSGLPKNSFMECLFWSARDPHQKLKRLPMDARESRYLPSWSWVGWKGAVQIPSETKGSPAFKVTVIDAANIMLSNCNPPNRFPPRLCKVMRRLRVILHLFADIWPCTVERKMVQSKGEVRYIIKTNNWEKRKKQNSQRQPPLDPSPEAMMPQDEDDYDAFRPRARPLFEPESEPVWPEIDRPERLENDSKFELIGLPDVPSHLMLVQHFPAFAERITLLLDESIVSNLKPIRRFIPLG